jgi:hypothetical protein
VAGRVSYLVRKLSSSCLSSLGRAQVVIQNARKREIDNKIFKFVGVAGVDKPRIVQVGVSAANLCR